MIFGSITPWLGRIALALFVIVAPRLVVAPAP